METFAKRELMAHRTNQTLLSIKRHGFISGRSTTTQLLNYLVDSMDLAKAFDSVPHRRRIAKLQSYGIKGKVIDSISAFLSQRTQAWSPK